MTLRDLPSMATVNREATALRREGVEDPKILALMLKGACVAGDGRCWQDGECHYGCIESIQEASERNSKHICACDRVEEILVELNNGKRPTRDKLTEAIDAVRLLRETVERLEASR